MNIYFPLSFVKNVCLSMNIYFPLSRWFLFIPVQFQWSNTGVNPKTGNYPSCEDSTLQSDLEYHIYVKYMQADSFDEDAYFDVIKEMLTADNVTKHGIWV